MEKATDFCVVFVTCDSYDSARNIARILVSEKLSACCSIIQNVTSVFEWEDVIDERNEYLMVIKTRTALLDILEKRVIELHMDEVPEIISFNLDAGSAPYLKWIDEITGTK